MEYRNKGLRARRMLKMIDERESEDENQNVQKTNNNLLADVLFMNDVLSVGDEPATLLNSASTTSQVEEIDDQCETAVENVESQPASHNCDHILENDWPSSSGGDYIDIIHEQVIRTPSTVSNLSYILDNVDFIASPEGIIRAVKSALETPTQYDTPNQSTACSSIEGNVNVNLKLNEHETFITEARNQFMNNSLSLEAENNVTEVTLTQQDISVINCNSLISSTSKDESTVQHSLIEFDGSETSKLLDESNVQSKTSSSVSEIMLSSSVETKNLEEVDYHATTNKKLTRKRLRNENEWIVNKSKTLKNTGQAYIGCHSKKQYDAKVIGPNCKCKLKCGETFSSYNRTNILNTFYKLGNHELQWQYITKYVESKSIKMLQVNRNKNRTQTLTYFLPLEGNKIRVCKVFFLNSLRISEQMVYTALEKGESDSSKTDKRGKHNNRPRKMSMSTEESIISHIQLFPVKEAHYVRKSSKRKYLCETLNISKMYRFYTDWFNEPSGEYNFNGVKMATKRQYENIFNTKYNYSFFYPKKDLCATCSLYEQAEGDRKESLKEKYTIHINNKEKVRQIKKYENDNFDDNSTLAIFDLEKVLGVPQSEVGIFHYKRKYPVYNFTVFDTTRKKGYCYLWHAQLAKRGAIEIGSCLYNFIEEQHRNQINKISFYSDGCAGQNKNRYIFALYIFATKKFNVEITHRFFESGHSQNEGDSMHACIERAMKNKQIYTPDQLYGIVINSKQKGEKYTVMEMRQNDFYDIKTLIAGQNWINDKKGNKIFWSKIKELKVTPINPDILYFKYNFDDEFNEMNVIPLSTKPTRKRKFTSTLPENDTLKLAYSGPIPISKALHEDLMSLCRSNAIPPNYHNFYNSLISVNSIENVQAEDNSEESSEEQ